MARGPQEGEMRGCRPDGLRAPNLMFPVSRIELTPVRACSVRLSWRLRARPSATLHEIQICREADWNTYRCSTAGPVRQAAGSPERHLAMMEAGRFRPRWPCEHLGQTRSG